MREEDCGWSGGNKVEVRVAIKAGKNRPVVWSISVIIRRTAQEYVFKYPSKRFTCIFTIEVKA